MDVDFLQQLREKSGLFKAPFLHAAASSEQVWREARSLHVFFTIGF